MILQFLTSIVLMGIAVLREGETNVRIDFERHPFDIAGLKTVIPLRDRRAASERYMSRCFYIEILEINK